MMPESDFQTPDPNGAPTSVLHKVVAGAGVGTIVIIGGAAAVFLLTVASQPTMGARHSYRLQWEQRQKDITAVQSQTDDTTPQAASDAEKAHE